MMRPRILPALVLGISLGAGCDRLTGGPDADPLERAGLHVAPSVLERYVGTYRLPSGGLFPVVRDRDRVLGGTRPHELLAQTSRRFRSNRLPGEFHFERSGPDGPISLRRRLGDRDYHCDRVDPKVARDP